MIGFFSNRCKKLQETNRVLYFTIYILHVETKMLADIIDLHKFNNENIVKMLF